MVQTQVSPPSSKARQQQSEFSLQDRYTVESGRIILSGIQALARLPIDQHRADMRRGLHTGSLITGYRGSPIGVLDMVLEQIPGLVANRFHRRPDDLGHARIAGILSNSRQKGIDWSQGDVSLLKDPTELALIRKMLLLPELVESMARTLEPHHLPHYALDLATAFHWFYENCRVLSSDPGDYPLTLARLKLVEAAQMVLSRTLSLMDMQAPERM